MREKIAIAVCWLTVAVVVGLSYVFAVRHNPDGGVVSIPEAAARTTDLLPSPRASAYPTTHLESPKPNGVAPSPEINRGRTVFGQQGCTTCHSIAANGNPRHPLDDTGARWNVEELRQWVCGTGIAETKLSNAVRGRKQRYQSLPAEDMKALVEYLSGLKREEK